MDARGVYRAKVEVRDPKTGKWVKGTKSFFPDSWVKSDIVEGVNSVFAHPSEVGLQQNGNVRIVGKSRVGASKGVRFVVILSPDASHVVTTYPIFSSR